jgi:hypothetical protein
MVGNVDDTAHTTQEKVIPKKRAGSGRTLGGGGKSVNTTRNVLTSDQLIVTTEKLVIDL